MSRRILLLLCPLFLATAVTTYAQSYPNDSFAWQDTHPLPPAKPEPPYVANMQPSPRFPITVQLRTDHALFKGANFVGRGVAHVFNPKGEDLNFEYRCGVAFPAYRPTEFYARWITPGRKLEITLRKPGTNHTRTCRISTTPHS